MKSYNAFDITKFIMAFLVIAIHTGVNNSNEIISFFCNIAVPMFFGLSGYLLMNSYLWGGSDKRYIFRILKLWLLWTAIYLPYTVYYYVVNDVGLVKSVALILRNTLFAGENYMSWPLWYLHALLIASVIIYYMTKYGAKVWTIFLTGCLLMLLGHFMNIIHHTKGTGLDYTMINSYYSVAISTRNGLFTGLAFISAGMCVRKYHEYLDNHKIFIAILSCVSLMMTIYDIVLGNVLLVACAVYYLSIIHLQDRPVYKWFRGMSTFIYLTHMLCIAPVVILSINAISGLQLFIYGSISAFCLSAILMRLKEYKKFVFLNNLI